MFKFMYPRHRRRSVGPILQDSNDVVILISDKDAIKAHLNASCAACFANSTIEGSALAMSKLRTCVGRNPEVWATEPGFRRAFADVRGHQGGRCGTEVFGTRRVERILQSIAMQLRLTPKA